ncbi:hypothetical protein SAMN05421874_104120 [Nonomuraea maritima]|uniref:Uncharacterized protein n=1 Tax=Nonomuraea maritima TaxID=683260 RepID=A0A1G8XSN6_9ACTN|nr:hypothetical protein SAMN05421874_104120 [Nonomuraea maritima]
MACRRTAWGRDARTPEPHQGHGAGCEALAPAGFS